uniref:Uncharacterized protein n=1 Tax=Mycena chlorophos TaxID=658473 RepID=A0ABQ0M6J9_MYCCL|nr:predicted protein [Mycena chlorophos]
MKYYNNDDDNTKGSKHGRSHNTLARPATLRREASKNTRYMNIASQTGDGARVLEAIQHLPLFVIAFTCAGIGALGMLWLWWRWNQNYLWLNHRIFSPGMLNSLAGIVSTLVNVYGVQHGEFSKTAKVTIIVTCASAIVCGSLTLFYTLFLLKRVRRAHNRKVGRERAGRHGEGFLEEIKRKANELEPGVA